jgi:hypothetical protein
MNKKQHNFYLKKAYDVKRNLWRCNDCDSETLFSKGYSQLRVNQFMNIKMPCIPPEEFKKQNGS